MTSRADAIRAAAGLGCWDNPRLSLLSAARRQRLCNGWETHSKDLALEGPHLNPQSPNHRGGISYPSAREVNPLASPSFPRGAALFQNVPSLTGLAAEELPSRQKRLCLTTPETGTSSFGDRHCHSLHHWCSEKNLLQETALRSPAAGA